MSGIFLFMVYSLGLVNCMQIAYADSSVTLTIKYANDTMPITVLSASKSMPYTLSQPYSWVKDQTSRYNLQAYSIDNGPYVDIPRVARGNFTIDIPTDSNHEIDFKTTIQYPIEIVGVDQVLFAPVSPTNDNWFDVNSDEKISVPHVIPLDVQNTREQLKGWSYDGEDSNQIQRSESGYFNTPLIHMSNSHSVNFIYTTQYYLNLVSEYGHVTGSGWYDSGTTATVSSNSNDDFPIRHVFSGWNGQVLDSNKQTTSIIMGEPAIITANWADDYTPVILMGVVVIAAIGTSGIILHKKRTRNSTRQIVSVPHENLQNTTRLEPSAEVRPEPSVNVVTDDVYSKEIDAYILEKSIKLLEMYQTSGILSTERCVNLKEKIHDGQSD